MRVEAEKQRALEASALSVSADRLTDREYVPFVETILEGGAAMPRSAKRDALRGHGGIGTFAVVRGHQPRHIDQHARRCGFSCQRAQPRAQICTCEFRPPVSASAALFDAMRCNSSAQDFTNACTPSR